MEVGSRWASVTTRIGYYAITGSDDTFAAPHEVFRRIGAEAETMITIITGSEVRDWAVIPRARAFFPGEDAEASTSRSFPVTTATPLACRTTLRNRRYLGSQRVPPTAGPGTAGITSQRQLGRIPGRLPFPGWPRTRTSFCSAARQPPAVSPCRPAARRRV